MKDIKLELGFMRHSLENREESQRMVDFAIQSGNPYFETCFFYMDYKCEEFIYSLLEKYDRKDYVLFGKAPIRGLVEKRGIESIFEEQIARVPGGYFDYYLLQAMSTKSDKICKEKNVIPYLLEQKKLGKIKHLGISVQCTPEELEKLLEYNCWEIIQMKLNYFDWYACRSNELYQIAKNHKLPIIAQSPMCTGILSDPNNINISNPSKFAIDFLSGLDIEYILSGCSHYNTYVDTFNCIKNAKAPANYSIYKKLLQNYLLTTKIDCNNCRNCMYYCAVEIVPMIKLYNMLINLDMTHRNEIFNLTTEFTDNLSKCKWCNEKFCATKCSKNIDLVKILSGIIGKISC